MQRCLLMEWSSSPALAMRRDTVACETSNPSFSSSPRIRGAPHKKILLAHPDYKRADLAPDLWASVAPAAA
jgi:hypothetical protein